MAMILNPNNRLWFVTGRTQPLTQKKKNHAMTRFSESAVIATTSSLVRQFKIKTKNDLPLGCMFNTVQPTDKIVKISFPLGDIVTVVNLVRAIPGKYFMHYIHVVSDY